MNYDWSWPRESLETIFGKKIPLCEACGSCFWTITDFRSSRPLCISDLDLFYILFSISTLLVFCFLEFLFESLFQTLLQPEALTGSPSILPRELHSSFDALHGFPLWIRRAMSELSTSIVQSFLRSRGQSCSLTSSRKNEIKGSAICAGCFYNLCGNLKIEGKSLYEERKRTPTFARNLIRRARIFAISFDEDFGILSYESLFRSREK